MIDSLLFSINAVFPIFLISVFGTALRAGNCLPDEFFTQSNRFVFRFALPITLFCDVVGGGTPDFGGRLTMYCCAFLLLEILLLLLIIPRFVRENTRRGAMIQGAFRSNVAIMGVPLIVSLFSDAGTTAMAAVMPIVIVLYNVFAVVILSIYAPADKKLSPTEIIRGILFSTAKNPLILGILTGLLFNLLPFSLPAFAEKTLGYIDSLTVPLALISLGASFRLSQLRGRLGFAAIVTLLRCMIFPCLAVFGAILLGFRDEQLGVVFVIFGSPTAIASFVMSESMGSDSVLSGQIVLLTTLVSAFTIFFGTCILKIFAFL